MGVSLFPPADPSVLARLVGVPYAPRGRTHDGADCWGIVLLAARDLWGLQLPEYFYAPQELQLLQDARDLIAVETAGTRWRAVAPPYGYGVVHTFRIRGEVTHCGIHLGGHVFLHSLPGRNSCLESLNDLDWCQRRTGTFAYE